MLELIKDSLKKDPIGVGSANSVLKFTDEDFHNYLLRTDQEPKNILLSENSGFVISQDDLEGRNFGQRVLSLARAQKLEIILNAGTCLNSEYIDLTQNFMDAGKDKAEARKQAYIQIIDDIANFPYESYVKMVEDVKHLFEKGKSIDNSRSNIARNGNQINFFDIVQDAYNFTRLPGYDGIPAALTSIDNDQISHDVKSSDKQIIQITGKIRDNVKKAINSVGPARTRSQVPETEMIQRSEIKLSLSPEAFLKKLSEIEKANNFQTIY